MPQKANIHSRSTMQGSPRVGYGCDCRSARWLRALSAGAGIARSEAAEEVYGIKRFCGGRYVEPCLSPGQAGDRWVKYRREQAVITKMLAEMCNRGVLC